MGLINASPLALGLLTEGGPQAWHRADPEVLAMGPRVAALCREHGKDIAQVALRFALEFEGVSSSLVGMNNVREVEANLAVLQQRSDPELLAEIRALVAPVYNRSWQEGLPENNV